MRQHEPIKKRIPLIRRPTVEVDRSAAAICAPKYHHVFVFALFSLCVFYLPNRWRYFMPTNVQILHNGWPFCALHQILLSKDGLSLLARNHSKCLNNNIIKCNKNSTRQTSRLHSGRHQTNTPFNSSQSDHKIDFFCIEICS